MARIVVLGGTGYAGSHIVEEAAGRGHEVVVASRTEPGEKVANATYAQVDVRDDAALAGLVDGADVVVSALSPRGDMADPQKFRAAMRGVADATEKAGARLGVVGGAGSLQVSEGGPMLVDTPDFPEEYADEPRTMAAVLDDLRTRESGLDWFMVSPAGGFNADNPGEARGTYRVGGDVLLSDEDGRSFISGADLGLAIVDEIEKPAHHRERFTVAY